MDIQENAFTEALLDDIEDGASRDIDDAWENFLDQASCHFNPILMNGPQPDEDEILPF